MNDATTRPTIVALYAHPDDEVFSAGGTLARYAEEGYVVLVVATRGELGEVVVPGLATPDNIHEVREAEVRESARILGIDEVRFLGYRDSGMAGTPGNDDPRSLLQSERTEAVGRIVRILRELRPQAVLTFEETGAYGHPDHITIHELTTLAFDAAGDANAYPEAGDPLEGARLFYSGMPRGVMKAFQQRAIEAGVDIGPLGQLDMDRFGLPDEAVDVVIDVTAFVERKLAAFRAHRTQFGDNQLIERIPPDLGREFIFNEYFQHARGEPLPGPKPAYRLIG